MIISPYKPEDQPATLDLLRANIPQYFAPEEYEDFVTYLEQKQEDYFIGKAKGKVVAAGGINYFPDTRSARISWDMIHPDYHGRGLGRQLLAHRLLRLQQHPAVDTVTVRTSQLAHGFYAKAGFKLIHQEVNFWAPGFHLYEMSLSLKPES
jgi:ribosomal-protein-alanine N-acetyltransferase